MLLSDAQHGPVWLVLRHGRSTVILVGTELAADLIRYRQGDPAQVMGTAVAIYGASRGSARSISMPRSARAKMTIAGTQIIGRSCWRLRWSATLNSCVNRCFLQCAWRRCGHR